MKFTVQKQLGPRRLARVIEAMRYGQWPTDDEVIDAIRSVPTHYIDLVITATLVVPYLTDISSPGIGGKKKIGETLLAGQWIYEKPTDSSRLWKAQCDGVAAEFGTLGVVLNGGSVGQWAQYQSSGDITIGGTMVAFTEYYLSAAAGLMCLRSDLVTPNRIIKLGYAKSATVFHIKIEDLGGAVPA